MTCHIVKERLTTNEGLPETLTELFVGFVENFLILRRQQTQEADVFAQFKDSVLKHAGMALSGMEQVPIKLIFSEKEIRQHQLENVAMNVVSESRELKFVKHRHITTKKYYFHHLTVQEFLSAVALVTDMERMHQMLETSPDRQLDLVVMFLAGLLGNRRNDDFLRSIDTCPDKRTRADSSQKLIQWVVAREREKEDNVDDDEKAEAHKASILLILAMLYESQKRELWCHASEYVLCSTGGLDLENQHISPVEMHALTYIIPAMNLSSLK